MTIGGECAMKADGGREEIKSSMSLRSKMGGKSGERRGRGRVVGQAEQARSRELEEEPMCEEAEGREAVSESSLVVAERLPKRKARSWRCRSVGAEEADGREDEEGEERVEARRSAA